MVVLAIASPVSLRPIRFMAVLPLPTLTIAFGLFAVGSVVLGDVVLLAALAFFVAALVLEWRERRATACLSLPASVA